MDTFTPRLTQKKSEAVCSPPCIAVVKIGLAIPPLSHTSSWNGAEVSPGITLPLSLLFVLELFIYILSEWMIIS
jgi:hypothetical protein